MLVNIDTLELTFDVFNYEESIQKYIPELEALKSQRSDSLYKGDETKGFINISGIDFEVMNVGKHGYAYILRNEDMELDIARWRSKKQEFYPIKVRFSAKLLWERGRMAYSYVADFIRRSFNHFGLTKVSRVDLACHVDNISPDITEIDNFVGRYKQDKAYRYDRKLETLYFGSRNSGKCMCRLYNKTAKCLRENDNTWFFDIWYNANMNLLNVWNIEFELHRDFLREFDIETYDDLTVTIHDLWLYLTTHWIRWCVPSHLERKRWETTATWETVQSAYAEFEFNGFTRREVQRVSDSTKYIPALSGFITSLAATLDYDDMDEALSYVKRSVQEYISKRKGTTFDDIVDEKKKALKEIDSLEFDLHKRFKSPLPRSKKHICPFCLSDNVVYYKKKKCFDCIACRKQWGA